MKKDEILFRRMKAINVSKMPRIKVVKFAILRTIDALNHKSLFDTLTVEHCSEYIDKPHYQQEEIYYHLITLMLIFVDWMDLKWFIPLVRN